MIMIVYFVQYLEQANHMNHNLLSSIAILGSILAFTSCKKEEKK